MGEMAQLFKMKITTTHLIEFCPGVWGFVGRVPAGLLYIDPTPEAMERAKFGERFGPKKRRFTSAKEARDFAAANGYRIDN